MCAGAVVSDPHDDVGVVGGDVVGSPPTHAPLWNEKRVENSEGEREREMMMMIVDRERFRAGSQYYSRMDEKIHSLSSSSSSSSSRLPTLSLSLSLSLPLSPSKKKRVSPRYG